MSFSQSLLKFVAGRFQVPPDAMDLLFASGQVGQPAETALPVPAELIPVGARLVLRGRMNNRFLSWNRDWVLPYWAERQLDPHDPGFEPHGLALYTINTAYRDWTTIGNPEREREAVVDPRGLVTPWFDGWSLDVWLVSDGRLFAPSRLDAGRVDQLLHENLPVVVTRWAAEGLQVSAQVFATQEPHGDEWLIQEITVANRTAAARSTALCLAVRPFNPEGVSLIHRIEYREATDTLGAFRVNDALGALLPKPDRVVCAGGDADVAHRLAVPGDTAIRAESAAGLASAATVYDLTLGPGESRTFIARLPMTPQSRDEDDPEMFSGLAELTAPAAARTATLGAWRQLLTQGLRIRVPDERLQNAFDANKAFLLLLHDGESITPGPFTYHQFWFRDAAYMLNALDKLGYHAQARRVIERFPRRLEKDGFLRGPEGEWDSNGAAIWTVVENARLSGDRTVAAGLYWHLLRMASWINSKRRKTQTGEPSPHAGLLPPGPSAEHLGPADCYYWDDFWALAGLSGAVQVADWMGLGKDAAKLRRNQQAFAANVDASLAAVAARQGRPAIPAAPTRRLDSAMIGSLAALYPLRLFEPDDPRIVDTLAALKEMAWVDGAYFNHVGHAAFGTYLALHIAECHLFRRDPEAWQIITWLLDHATPTFTWAEGINPRTMRGGMGDGHHGWAVADFLIAVRNMLLLEEKDHLVITPVLPESWTVENNVVNVEDAPTYFGTVSYTIAFGERTGTLVIKPDWRQEPEYVEWALPFAIREAGAENGTVQVVGRTVRLPRGVSRVVVMW